MSKNNVLIVNNIVAPYRRPVFDKLVEKLGCDDYASTTVLYLTEKESVRSWSIDKLKDYEYILPTLIQIRNKFTTTSDVIINHSFLNHFISSSKIVIFGYNYPTYLILAILSKFSKKKCALFCESTIIDKKRSRFKYYLKKLFLNSLFDGFIVPGKSSYEYLRSFGIAEDSIKFAPNSYTPSLKPNGNLACRHPEKPILTFIGRFSEEKNIKFVMDILHKEGIDFTFHLIGDGPLSCSLNEHYKSDERFVFLGHLNKNEIELKLLNSDVIILPSLSEPWGLVINEAISLGNAVLCSENVGCCNELVDGNGAIFSPYDSDSFMNAFNNVLDNIDVYKNKSYQISLNYTFETQSDCFSKIIRNL